MAQYLKIEVNTIFFQLVTESLIRVCVSKVKQMNWLNYLKMDAKGQFRLHLRNLKKFI